MYMALQSSFERFNAWKCLWVVDHLLVEMKDENSALWEVPMLRSPFFIFCIWCSTEAELNNELSGKNISPDLQKTACSALCLEAKRT